MEEVVFSNGTGAVDMIPFEGTAVHRSIVALIAKIRLSLRQNVTFMFHSTLGHTRNSILVFVATTRVRSNIYNYR